MQATTSSDLEDAPLTVSVLTTLAAQEPPALFATELRRRLQASGADPAGLEDALRQLDRDGSVLVTTPPAPDPHLAALDLRIVALVPRDLPPSDAMLAATRATDVVWGRWLREFLASHRCQ